MSTQSSDEFYKFNLTPETANDNNSESLFEIIEERNTPVINLISPTTSPQNSTEPTDSEMTVEKPCICPRCDQEMKEYCLEGILANKIDESLQKALKRKCRNGKDKNENNVNDDDLDSNIDPWEIEGHLVVEAFLKNQIQKG